MVYYTNGYCQSKYIKQHFSWKCFWWQFATNVDIFEIIFDLIDISIFYLSLVSKIYLIVWGKKLCPNKHQKQTPEVFCQKDNLKNFANFRGKHLCCTVFLIKLIRFYEKETPTQIFSCETFKGKYFEEHLRTTASETFTCSKSITDTLEKTEN